MYADIDTETTGLVSINKTVSAPKCSLKQTVPKFDAVK